MMKSLMMSLSLHAYPGLYQVILKTGELQELEDLKNDTDVVALRELRSVPRSIDAI